MTIINMVGGGGGTSTGDLGFVRYLSSGYYPYVRFSDITTTIEGSSASGRYISFTNSGTVTGVGNTTTIGATSTSTGGMEYTDVSSIADTPLTDTSSYISKFMTIAPEVPVEGTLYMAAFIHPTSYSSSQGMIGMTLNTVSYKVVPVEYTRDGNTLTLNLSGLTVGDLATVVGEEKQIISRSGNGPFGLYGAIIGFSGKS